MIPTEEWLPPDAFTEEYRSTMEDEEYIFPVPLTGTFTSPVRLVGQATKVPLVPGNITLSMVSGGMYSARAALTLEYRTSVDGISWSPWAVANNGKVNYPAYGVYVQYRLRFEITGHLAYPIVDKVTIEGKDLRNESSFRPLTDVIVYRKVNGVEYATYLRDILHASIECGGSAGAQTLTLEINNESGKYNPNSNSEINYVNTPSGPVWHPLFKSDNKIRVRLGARYPDNSEVWEPEHYGPFYVDEPEYGISAGEHVLRVTARDRMKFLMRDIFVGKFEPEKILATNVQLTKNATLDICLFPQQNICKDPKPIVWWCRHGNPDYTTYLLSGYMVDYAAGRLFLDTPLRGTDDTIYSTYYYYNMATNKLGDVLRTIIKDAGIPEEDIELSFVSSDGTIIEPTLPKIVFTPENGKTHFDCIRQILRDFMPPNYTIYASGDKIKGRFVYQKAVPDGEIVTAEQVRAVISEEELYTRAVAYGRASIEDNLALGKPVMDVAPGGFTRVGNRNYIVDGKTFTQFKWAVKYYDLTPCDLFIVDLRDVYTLGRVMMLQGDDDYGNAVTSLYVIYKSLDGVTWEPLCNDAIAFQISTGQWFDVDEASLGDDNRARYLKVHCLQTTDNVRYWRNIAVREFRVFPTTKVVGEAKLWIDGPDWVCNFTVPSAPPYTVTITSTFSGNPAHGVLSHPRLKPRVVLSDGTTLNVVESPTAVTQSPDPDTVLVTYGGLDGPTQVAFHPSLAGETGTIHYAYIVTGIPRTPNREVVEYYIQMSKAKFETVNRIGPKTLVLPESYARTSEAIAREDAARTLALLWQGTEQSELTLPWAPHIELFGTYRYVNFDLGINSTYLVEGISLDLTAPSTALTLTNYRYGGVPNASLRLVSQMTRLIKDTINEIGVLPKQRYTSL